MNACCGEHVGLDQLVQRRQHRRACAYVISHCRERNVDPLSFVFLALPIERLMIGVLLDQDHRQQARPGKAARDRMEWRRRL
jgi:hypothetical protein